jgi:hypothetical protein
MQVPYILIIDVTFDSLYFLLILTVRFLSSTFLFIDVFFCALQHGKGKGLLKKDHLDVVETGLNLIIPFILM